MPKPKQIVTTFEDRFGDVRRIYRESPRSALKLAKLSDTVSHKMNRVCAVLIGQRIKEKRVAAFMTLEALCLRAGLKAANPKTRMWEIENSIREEGLRMGTLFALAHALGCEAIDLLPTVAEVAEMAGVEVKATPALSVA